MRRIRTTAELLTEMSPSALRWAIKQHHWRLVERSVYIEGTKPPTQFERALATTRVSNAVAAFTLAATLHEFDNYDDSRYFLMRKPFAIALPTKTKRRAGVKSRALEPDRVTQTSGIACTDAFQTLLDLAQMQDVAHWEQSLEFALRHNVCTIEQIELALPELGRARTPGVSVMRKVLAVRPRGAPPAESLLETLGIQLIRNESRLPPPTRQLKIFRGYGPPIARLDLAWPELGAFIELDGQDHLNQPQYDSSRESEVVRVTGWLPQRLF